MTIALKFVCIACSLVFATSLKTSLHSSTGEQIEPETYPENYVQQLKNEGFTPEQLYAAGFTGRELRDVGVAVYRLKNLGENTELIRAEDKAFAAMATGRAIMSSEKTEWRKKYRVAKLMKIELARAQRAQPMENKTEWEARRTEYITRLKRDGFTPEQLYAAGFTGRELRNAGVAMYRLERLGEDVKDLNAADKAYWGASFSIGHQLSTRERIAWRNGFKAVKRAEIEAARPQRTQPKVDPETQPVEYISQLKDEGFDNVTQLYEAGFTVRDLRDAGFSYPKLETIGLNITRLKAQDEAEADMTLEERIAARNQQKANNMAEIEATRALRMQPAEYLSQLKAEGFNDVTQLYTAGFTGRELKDAGFDYNELEAAGIPTAQLEAQDRTESSMSLEEKLAFRKKQTAEKRAEIDAAHKQKVEEKAEAEAARAKQATDETPAE